MVWKVYGVFLNLAGLTIEKRLIATFYDKDWAESFARDANEDMNRKRWSYIVEECRIGETE